MSGADDGGVRPNDTFTAQTGRAETSAVNSTGPRRTLAPLVTETRKGVDMTLVRILRLRLILGNRTPPCRARRGWGIGGVCYQKWWGLLSKRIMAYPGRILMYHGVSH